MISPYRLGRTKTLKSDLRAGSISLAVVMSMNHTSCLTSGYSLPISSARSTNRPSVVLMMLALTMMET